MGKKSRIIKKNDSVKLNEGNASPYIIFSSHFSSLLLNVIPVLKLFRIVLQKGEWFLGNFTYPFDKVDWILC